MKINRHVIVFDAPDLATEIAFWSGLLGGTVVADDGWRSVVVDGELPSSNSSRVRDKPGAMALSTLTARTEYARLRPLKCK